ncbi:MAG: hypothetical protein VX278_09535 [Myxococcota bacterium]|nr:hypothetical protein [Myxococcota bacterium]
MNRLFLLTIAFELACEDLDKESEDANLVSDSGNPNLTIDTASDTAVTDTCGVSVLTYYPESGSSDFFYRDRMRFELSELDESATVALRNESGEIPGNTFIDGPFVWFTPDQPLEPETGYIVYISLCENEEIQEFTFQTSNYGLPITANLEGKTFAFNFGSGRLVPEEFQMSLAGMVENNILLGIDKQDGNRLSFISSSSLDGNFNQDYCVVSNDTFQDGDISSPEIRVEAPNVLFRSKGQDLNLRNYSMMMTMSPDGTQFRNGYWSAEADIREFALLLNQAS